MENLPYLIAFLTWIVESPVAPELMPLEKALVSICRVKKLIFLSNFFGNEFEFSKRNSVAWGIPFDIEGIDGDLDSL